VSDELGVQNNDARRITAETHLSDAKHYLATTLVFWKSLSDHNSQSIRQSLLSGYRSGLFAVATYLDVPTADIPQDGFEHEHLVVARWLSQSGMLHTRIDRDLLALREARFDGNQLLLNLSEFLDEAEALPHKNSRESKSLI